jgi:hypothetical protein
MAHHPDIKTSLFITGYSISNQVKMSYDGKKNSYTDKKSYPGEKNFTPKTKLQTWV